MQRRATSGEMGAVGGLWLLWFIAVLIVGLVRPSPTALTVILLVHLLTTVVLLHVTSGLLGLVLAVSLILRVVLIAIDLTTNIALFSSGGDTENFYQTAFQLRLHPELFRADVYGGLYSKIVGLLFELTGPTKLLVQYTNSLLGLSSLLLISRAARILDIPDMVRILVLCVWAFMPVSLILSAIFLREALITALISAFVLAFAHWTARPSTASLAVAVTFLSMAAAFHTGVVGVFGGVLLAVVLYGPRDRMSFSAGKFLRWAPVLVPVVTLFLMFPGTFFGKLRAIDSSADLYGRVANSRGGSAYLPGVSVDGPVEFFLFSGLKGVFFLLSPVPFQWRGLPDVLAFSVDAGIFAVAVVVCIRGLMKRRVSSQLLPTLGVFAACAITAVLIFGSGTGNSGTAMRHRHKLAPLFAVTVMIAAHRRSIVRQIEVGETVDRFDRGRRLVDSDEASPVLRSKGPE